MDTINKEKTTNLRQMKMCYKRKMNKLIQRTEELSLPQRVTGLISGADLRISVTIDYTVSPYSTLYTFNQNAFSVGYNYLF